MNPCDSWPSKNPDDRPHNPYEALFNYETARIHEPSYEEIIAKRKDKTKNKSLKQKIQQFSTTPLVTVTTTAGAGMLGAYFLVSGRDHKVTADSEFEIFVDNAVSRREKSPPQKQYQGTQVSSLQQPENYVQHINLSARNYTLGLILCGYACFKCIKHIFLP